MDTTEQQTDFTYVWTFHKYGGSDNKESACNAGDPGSILGWGRFPGEGNGYPHHYSCLENPMDRGARWGIVHGVAKSRTRLSDFTFFTTTAFITVLCVNYSQALLSVVLFFSSVLQPCQTLCGPMDCSMPGFPFFTISLSLPKLISTESMMPSNILSSVIPFSCPQSFPALGFFPMSQFFASGGQSIGASASASVLPMYIQG